MREFLTLYMPWLLSVITIYQMKVTGDKRTIAWLIMIFNQAMWLIWIVCAETWGLIPMNIALWVMAIRNYRKWKQAEEVNG